MNDFKIWLAGFFDGEGCVNITKFRENLCVRIMVTNTNREVLELIRSVYGGDIQELKRTNPKWKTGYTLRIQHGRAVKMLKDIFPYLRLKNSQAKLAIDFYGDNDCELVQGPSEDAPWRFYKRLTEEAISKRQSIKNQMMILNQKGL